MPDFDTKLAPIAGASCALCPDGAEILSRGGFSTKFGVETGKMNTAARRNRFYAKKRSERMKWDPFWKKWVRPVAFAFYGASASIDGISKNDSGDYDFLRRHMGFIIQTAYGVSPNTATADNRFSGVGTHPSLLTTQSIRMGLQFDGFPHRPPSDRMILTRSNYQQEVIMMTPLPDI